MNLLHELFQLQIWQNHNHKVGVKGISHITGKRHFQLHNQLRVETTVASKMNTNLRFLLHLSPIHLVHQIQYRDNADL